MLVTALISATVDAREIVFEKIICRVFALEHFLTYLMIKVFALIICRYFEGQLTPISEVDDVENATEALPVRVTEAAEKVHFQNWASIRLIHFFFK